jgi:hypothetical protein
MTSVIATRKLAGEGNYFVVLGDASADNFFTATVEALPDGDFAPSGEGVYAPGTLLKDLGKRRTAVDGDRVQVLAKVVDAAQNADPTYVVVRDTIAEVQVALVGAGTRN